MKIESMHAGEFLLSEGAGNISREAINVAAGAALEPGQILGLVTLTSEFAPYKPTAEDGTENAIAILYGPLGESDVPRRGRAIVRLAEVSEAHLTGLDPAAEKALATHFVIVR
ncbi:head decoration protein [Pseudomonas sp. CBSPBW29]|uniref:head decoration protein n=1 Tax=Pseudomonas sp. CBS TaxID=2971912 RepID=UPI0021AC9E5B|nr:head decoration protein [Pseudomonas sp. CBS]WEL43161.1 head decoration protein [Pseudomonas sp. CBSPBW29]WEL64228.1 head decoration protein [Pseudomonas sp. CBSPGW29]WEL73408.1 head decoration protein [Pseudomonas sp. CBSPCGW29]WEL74728.1 head decoration protein [Pseudomonas sp. CBSPAW29]WEL81031.1 head decoration protein [Pseudomonas sp. CBSPCAW29]WEL89538.1 head decoration protein [Pseudomonas sp. CBSPCBW29]